MKLKSHITRLLPHQIKMWLFHGVAGQWITGFFDPYCVKSYSQEGEDMILRRIFAGRSNGFYVDVGAHHPRRFSNTYYFYCRGWRGINIEPNPDAIRAFQMDRRRDKNLQLGVSDKDDMITYYMFDEPALNTFDSATAKSRLENTAYELKEKIDVEVERLDCIFREHLPPGVEIDFLSVDVEGGDCLVLKSNDWDLYRPRCVLVEALEAPLDEVMHSEIFLYMKSQEYKLLAKTFNTLVFYDKHENNAH